MQESPACLSLRFRFSSKTQDTGEMPAVERSYAIIASDWEGPGSGRATIFPLNQNLPLPENIHHHSETGGPAEALRRARDAVLGLSANEGLIRSPLNLDNFISF